MSTISIKSYHPDSEEIVSSTGASSRVASGFIFTEGPVWHPIQRYLIFSDIAASRQYRWSETTGCQLFRTPSNQSNGNAFDRSGRVVTCEHASSQVIRIAHDGKLIQPIATHYQGKELNSPNDVVVDSQNRVWFTDPSFGRLREDLGLIREQALAFQGVYRLDTDSSLHLVASQFNQPNGLCLSIDEKHIFVNDTVTAEIFRFDVSESGELLDGKLWGCVQGKGEGVADGLKVSVEGHLLCNGPGGVHVFNESAELLCVLETPEKSTNFAFGGSELKTLFITASTSVYSIDLRVSGLPAF